LYWPQFLEFVMARVAEAPQQIDRAIDGHFAQFDEAATSSALWITRFEDSARIMLSLA